MRNQEEKDEYGNLIAEISAIITTMPKTDFSNQEFRTMMYIRGMFGNLGRLNDVTHDKVVLSLFTAITIVKAESLIGMKKIRRGLIRSYLSARTTLIKYNCKDNSFGAVYPLLRSISKSKVFYDGDTQADHNKNHYVEHISFLAEILLSSMEFDYNYWKASLIRFEGHPSDTSFCHKEVLMRLENASVNVATAANHITPGDGVSQLIDKVERILYLYRLIGVE